LLSLFSHILKAQFDGLSDVCQGLFDCVPLAITAGQRWAGHDIPACLIRLQDYLEIIDLHAISLLSGGFVTHIFRGVKLQKSPWGNRWSAESRVPARGGWP
jgi:hypothetical protein